MWILALVIACSAGGDVCTYRSEPVVTKTYEDCLFFGHFVGGRAMVQAYGTFPIGTVTVTCRPLITTVTVASSR